MFTMSLVRLQLVISVLQINNFSLVSTIMIKDLNTLSETGMRVKDVGELEVLLLTSCIICSCITRISPLLD